VVSRARLFWQSAPGGATWLYLAWILAAHSLDWDGQWSVIRRLSTFQLWVIVAGLSGGVAAFWLPSRALRIGIAAGSLLGAELLYEAFLGVAFGGA